MRSIKLVTYQPLCYTHMGMQAIQNHQLPPFIDNSCRREPDLENKYPSISSLCRKTALATKLKEGDIVIYMTKPGKYKASKKYLNRTQYKLVAILEVIKTCPTHEEASKWYNQSGEVVPNNCMIENSTPNDFFRTGGNFHNQTEILEFLEKPEKRKEKLAIAKIKDWNKHYQIRADQHGQFNITKPIYKNLETPPEIPRESLKSWFGKIPMTLHPYKMTEEQYNEFLNLTK